MQKSTWWLVGGIAALALSLGGALAWTWPGAQPGASAAGPEASYGAQSGEAAAPALPAADAVVVTIEGFAYRPAALPGAQAPGRSVMQGSTTPGSQEQPSSTTPLQLLSRRSSQISISSLHRQSMPSSICPSQSLSTPSQTSSRGEPSPMLWPHRPSGAQMLDPSTH